MTKCPEITAEFLGLARCRLRRRAYRGTARGVGGLARPQPASPAAIPRPHPHPPASPVLGQGRAVVPGRAGAGHGRCWR